MQHPYVCKLLQNKQVDGQSFSKNIADKTQAFLS